MKLAEALILRADAQNRINSLRARLTRIARVQEGETPAEDPQELLSELNRTVDQLEDLIQSINRTNAVTTLADGQTLTDALAQRDMLALRRGVLDAIVNQAAAQAQRYSFSEIRMVATMSVPELQSQIDDLARQYRELDSQVQQLNWEVDLIET